MLNFNNKLAGTGTTIFTTMSQLAATHGAINLSQGFPDFGCSPVLTGLVNGYMKQGYNQYAPMAGVMKLRESIAEKVDYLYGAAYHPESEITITSGATQTIFTAIAAVINPGDEVILFEPAYDCYAPAVKLFGGVNRPVLLTAQAGFEIDWTEVTSLITPRTRLIIINTPNNPSARVFTDSDMQQLSALTRNTNILVISDEVYEHLVFNQATHQSVISYTALRERSFVVASFGKLYHNTGWKIGYCLAPAHLMDAFRTIHQYLVFSVNTPIQYALAEFLQKRDEYLQLGSFLQQKYDYFRAGMKHSAFELLPSSGTYFVLAGYASISDLYDTDFCIRLTVEHQVAAIPLSPFYSAASGQRLIRFCFAKKQETLEKALEKLVKVNSLG